MLLNIIDKFSPTLKDRIEILLNNFLEGMNSFRKNKRLLIFIIFLSIPIWLFETLTLVLLFYLIGYEINIFIIILSQIILFFTKVFPIIPGGWIISENIGALLICLFYPSIPYQNILSIFILDHIIRTVYILIYGIISSITFNFKVRHMNIKKIKEDLVKIQKIRRNR